MNNFHLLKILLRNYYPSLRCLRANSVQGARVQGTNTLGEDGNLNAYLQHGATSSATELCTGCVEIVTLALAAEGRDGISAWGAREGVREEVRTKVWDVIKGQGQVQSKQTWTSVTESGWCHHLAVWCGAENEIVS